MKELVFEVTQEEVGGYGAECLTENIFTQGDTSDDVRTNVGEAVRVIAGHKGVERQQVLDTLR